MKSTTRWYIFWVYTVLFAALCMVVFHPFYANHISLIWGSKGQDGLSQHLPSLVYFGEYVRNFFSNLIHGNFHLPMWDMSIGYGSDILSTLNYYSIGDPLNLIYAFSNKYNAEYFYNFMIILRLYLAGISFIVFGCYLKKNPHGILVGSFTYIFSGVFFISGIRHPFFLNPMIYLPLLIMGVEKIYRKERPYLFTIIVAVSAMSNFYFFYMLTAAAVIYALIRFPVYKQDGFFKTLGRFALWYLLGIGLAMVILLPVLISFSNNARNASSTNYFDIFLYPKVYYKEVIQQSIGYQQINRSTSLNYIALAYCSVIALFLKKSKERFAYKISLIAGVIFVLFPIFGYVLHAFSYPVNRWIFILAFVIASIVTEVYEDLLNLTIPQKLGILAGVAFYALFYKYKSSGILEVKLAAIVLILTCFVLILINELPFLSKFHLRDFMMYGLVVVSISISAFVHYSGQVTDIKKSYVPSGTAYELLCGQESKILQKAHVKNNQLDRVESINGEVTNWGMIDHIPNTSNYFSITDKNVSDTLMGLGIKQYQYKFKFKKLDLRENLMDLYNVKYVITNSISKKKLPKSYRLIAQNADKKLYKNQNPLPFGYTYDVYIYSQKYNNLSPAQKEDAMIQSAVIDDGTSTNLKTDSFVDHTITKVIKTNYHIHKKNLKKQQYHIKVPTKYITKHSYLYLKNVRSAPLTNGQRHVLSEGLNKNKLHVKLGHNSRAALFNAEEGSVYDTGKRDYLIPIDASRIKDSKTTDLAFILKRPNNYTVDQIAIIQLNKKAQRQALSKLRKSPHLTNIAYDGSNHFSGDIKTTDERILCIPISYNRGWKITDNGKSLKLLKVNGMFCGVLLNSGNHHIRLDYTTPGLKIGACISLISLIILCGTAIYRRKHNQKL